MNAPTVDEVLRYLERVCKPMEIQEAALAAAVARLSAQIDEQMMQLAREEQSAFPTTEPHLLEVGK